MTLFSIQQQYSFLRLCDAWHLVYYIPSNQDHTIYSSMLLKFKNNDKNIVNKWCQWTSNELGSQENKFDYIVRALGSSELQPSGLKGLDTLGYYLEERHGWAYVPSTLKKLEITPPMHTLKTLKERKEVINESYSVDNFSNNLNQKSILIIDDVTTTNVTISEILRALRVEWPYGRYFLFCLGKTNYNPESNALIGQNYFN
ncbi:hypothetical protein [Desulfurivibrio sp. C05AmB]|uniref:hypothetical protein n=1 Tax=Desulfurivibrio sp. C05AmB TaxID=3374371 RepID=UPI00376EECD4